MVLTCHACSSDQQPQARRQEASPKAQPAAMVFQGTLVQVDHDAKTLVVKSAEEKELQFTYTDATETVGTENTIQGLAGKPGENVKITYTVDQGVNHANRVEILPQ
jgi:hypothetical protein